jgi:F plasmid transfer operon, TraF, protein
MTPATRMRTFVLAGFTFMPAVLVAQSGQNTARAVAMGQSMTASARGYEAIVWNPALLGMPGRPGFSFNLIQAGVSAHSTALGPSDLWHYYHTDTLSVADKNDILAKVRTTSDSTLGVGVLGDVMGVGLTFKNFGVALLGTADGNLAVSSDAVELALFGNTARRAPGERYLGTGSQGAGVGAASLAFSWGQGFRLPVGHLAVGATVKYTRTLMAAQASDLGSYVQNEPSFAARVGGHALAFDWDKSHFNGSGIGVDLGAAYQFVSGIRIAASIQNLVSTMSWSDSNLVYYRKEYLLQQDANGLTYSDSTITNIDKAPYNASDPAQKALRDSLLTGHPLGTMLRLGAQLSAGPVLLAGDAQFRVAKGIVAGPAQRLSVGAELPLSVIRLRGGVASDFSGGFSLSGGLGFKLGPVRLDFAAATTPGGDRQGLMVATGLSVMN